MNEKKRLGIVLISLVVVVALSVLLYSMYKDQIDPVTGKWAPTSSDATVTTAAMDQAAPDFTMEDANGKTVKLSDFKGKPVVLNFWASSCGYCKAEMPYFESAFQEYGDKVQFVMLNVTGSEQNAGDGRTFIQNAPYTFPVYYETANKAMGLYGLRGLPTTVFIDADGKIVQKTIGAITEAKLENNLKALLG